MRWSSLFVAGLVLSSALLIATPSSRGERPPLPCAFSTCDEAWPRLVTGHSVYAQIFGAGQQEPHIRFVPLRGLDWNAAQSDPTVKWVAPSFRVLMAECVVAFNGGNLNQRPASDPNDWGSGNWYPSDEDGAPAGRDDDAAYQDYDMDRLVDTCLPNTAPVLTEQPEVTGVATDFAALFGIVIDDPERVLRHVVLVERGDCPPRHGLDFRFRGHLDFVDTNHIYHEVQEYDYVCPDQGGARLDDRFPWTRSDPHNREGCRQYATPADTANGTDPGHFDYGHKCNGTLQDLTTERLWITTVHDPVLDRTIQRRYTFGLQVDTCAGLNIFEGYPVLFDGSGSPGRPGEEVAHRNNGSASSGALAQAAELLAAAGAGVRGADRCIDGSSYSFDDTTRGDTHHFRPPHDELILQEGLSYGFDPSAGTTFGKHRQNCRSNLMEWAFEQEGTDRRQAECLPEWHRTAAYDLYAYATDPTGLYALHTNGLTGPNAYVPSLGSGPDDVVY